MYKYYYATIRHAIQQETASGKIKIKFKKDNYIVHATNITQAETILKSILSSVYDNFQIIGIKQSDISGIINDVEDVLKQGERKKCL